MVIPGAGPGNLGLDRGPGPGGSGVEPRGGRGGRGGVVEEEGLVLGLQPRGRGARVPGGRGREVLDRAMVRGVGSGLRNMMMSGGGHVLCNNRHQTLINNPVKY